MFEFRKMKRAVALILCACCLISFAACTPEEKPSEPLKDNSGMTYDRYDLETYLYPLWEGNTVYNETIWFAGDNFAPLLYVPDEILSVKSYDLETTYEEGTDYLVDEDSIALAYKSGIPSLSMSQLYGDVPINPQIAVTVLPELPNGGKYLYVDEGATISRQQVAVTYTHHRMGAAPRRDGEVPQDHGKAGERRVDQSALLRRFHHGRGEFQRVYQHQAVRGVVCEYGKVVYGRALSGGGDRL